MSKKLFFLLIVMMAIVNLSFSQTKRKNKFEQKTKEKHSRIVTNQLKAGVEPTNSAEYSSFAEGCQETNFKLNLTTDNYASETSWILKNIDGEIIKRSRPNLSNNTFYEDGYCLSPGWYTFEILDSYGDGICCEEGNGDFSIDINTNLRYSGRSKKEYFRDIYIETFYIGQDNTNDTIPPTEIENLKVKNLTSSSIEAYWSPSVDNSGDLNYAVFLDGKIFTITKDLFATLTLINKNLLVSHYNLRVYAYDAAGNFNFSDLNFSGLGPGKMTVEINTDDYGEETSWFIKNDDDEIVMSGNNYASNNSYSHSKELEDGCYTFEIVDSHGDGMCCEHGNGYFNLIINNTQGEGGQSYFDNNNKSFDYKLSKKFCIVDGKMDTEKPTAPVLKLRKKTFNSLEFEWTASSDNSKLSHYLFRGEEIPVNQLSGIIENLDPLTFYSVTVKAVDVDGNIQSSNTLRKSTNVHPFLDVLTIKYFRVSGIPAWWTLKDEDGNIIKHTVLRYGITLDKILVPKGCYTLEVSDPTGGVTTLIENDAISNGGRNYYILKSNRLFIHRGGRENEPNIYSFCSDNSNPRPSEEIYFDIYPNPIIKGQNLIISENSIEEGTYRIVNTQGETIISGDYYLGMNINTSNLPLGLNYIVLKSENKIARSSFLVQ